MKDSAATRWGILLLVASVQAANYYFYDAISPQIGSASCRERV